MFQRIAMLRNKYLPQIVRPLTGYGLTKIALLRRMYRFLISSDGILPYNEWFVDGPWFLSHLNGGGRIVLDTGFITHEFITKQICRLGHIVWGIDIGVWGRDWCSPNFIYLKADLTEPLPFPEGVFDVVFSPSLVEHLGLGYYGEKVKDNADIAIVKEFWRILRPGGVLLMQVPFGSTARLIRGGEMLREVNKDTLFYRIYTHDIFWELLNGFVIEEVSYARFYRNQIWQITDEATACQTDWTQIPTQCIVRVKARKSA